jgi:hypothetical protein
MDRILLAMGYIDKYNRANGSVLLFMIWGCSEPNYVTE